MLTSCRLTAMVRSAIVAVLCGLLLTVGCASQPTPPEAQATQAGLNPDDPLVAQAGLDPDAIVRNFFIDLEAALANPDLADPTVRAELATGLAEYFAPSERADQRAMLRDSLYNFWLGQEQVKADNQTVTLTVDYQSTRVELSADRQRADVVLEDAAILVRFITIGQTAPDYESRVPLANIVGNPAGSVPTVNVGGRWYLTEG